MSSLTLQDIYIYPIKSMGGIHPEEIAIHPQGPEFDRRFLLVRPNGRFLTQRQVPHMALISARLSDGRLHVTKAGMPPLNLPLEPRCNTRLRVKIFKDSVEAGLISKTVDSWFSQALGEPCRLVFMDEHCQRQVTQKYGRPDDTVSFADAMPLLLISQASLDLLNSKLDQPVDMARFRPNLVISGCEPHEEDRWRRIRIGSVEFEFTHACARCVLTTVDPATGTFGPRTDPSLGAMSAEPLRTLRSYRLVGPEVLFGQNLLPRSLGTIRNGDPVTILE